MIRPLNVNKEQQEAIDHLVRFARQPDAWFEAFRSRWIPGDNPQYVLHVDTYRCVFTYTLMPDGSVHRHLSVSVPDAYPNPIAVFQLAVMFGFKGGKDQSGICCGPGDDWQIALNEQEHCVVVAQVAMLPGKGEDEGISR